MKTYLKIKDSGIGWIGEIPEQWECKKIKFDFKIQSGKTLNSKQKEDQILVPYLTTSHVFWDNVIINDDLPMMYATQEEINRHLIKKNDLLVCEGGEGGRSAVIKKIDRQIITQNHVHIVRSKKGSNTKFLMYVLETIKNANWFDAITTRVTISNLPSQTLANIKIPFPSEDEQKQIAKFLDREVIKINSLMFGNKLQHEILSEYRHVLISSAVTGKIDVRQEIVA